MISLEGVTKSYGSLTVLENLMLSVARGESLCIAGPSGCGKSTLLKLIALISYPDAGSIFIDGKDASSERSSEREGFRNSIGYSFQEPLLLPYLSAIENIVDVVSKPTSTVQRRKEAQQTLSQLGMLERAGHLPSKLSVGEKKRVDLARALYRNPTLLVADEPFSSLDPGTGRLVAKTLRDYVGRGGTLTYSSVDPRKQDIADRTLDLTKHIEA